jgi:hypothetical protein
MKPVPLGTLEPGTRFQLASYEPNRTGRVVDHSPCGTSVTFDPYTRILAGKDYKETPPGGLISSGTSVLPLFD